MENEQVTTEIKTISRNYLEQKFKKWSGSGEGDGFWSGVSLLEDVLNNLEVSLMETKDPRELALHLHKYIYAQRKILKNNG